MTEARDYSVNPFVALPPSDFTRRIDPQGLFGSLGRNDPIDNGPLLTPAELAALHSAPRKPAGTYVTVRAGPVAMAGGAADHMHAEYDDGAEQYIFRGGPKWPFLHAEVTPAIDSPDYAHGDRILYQTYLPGVSAREAIRPAQARAAQINGAHQPYLILDSNSNSVIGDFTSDQFGRRIGDGRTPGYQSQPLYPMTQPIW
jgi:hypothetical protein